MDDIDKTTNGDSAPTNAGESGRTTVESGPQSISLKILIESLLFVAEGPVTVRALAGALEVAEEQVEQALEELRADYSRRGIRVQRARGQVQLVTAPELAPVIERFLGVSGSSHLSAAALETLAIIAYRQPVTRPAIEAIRGVNCDGVIHSLLVRGLIQETGRLETAGRPILYATTFDFLQQFGLQGREDLPPLEEATDRVLSAAVEQAQQAADSISERVK
jgi:segregation and condensation protein B